MTKTCLGAIIIAFALSGCAVQGHDGDDDELVAATHAALSTASTPKGTWMLFANATHDSHTHQTMIDLDTRDPQAGGSDPHINGDRFVSVMVYRLRDDGRRDVLTVLGGQHIGPGGGCIHFSVPAATGDRLLIGGVVRLFDQQGARVAVAPELTVVSGEWSDDHVHELEH